MSVASEITWVVCVGYHDGTAERMAWFSSGVGWRTLPTDEPANTEIEPRLIRPPEFLRMIYGDRRTVGRSEVGFGDIVLANADGRLADWPSYGFGRLLQVWVGREGTPFPSAWTLFLRGTVQMAHLRANDIVLQLRDLRQELQRPIQTNVYAGDNEGSEGFEGTAEDLRGQPKPLVYGYCQQVPCIQVNAARHLYQVHDGPLEAVLACRDMGAAFGFDQDLATKEALAAHEVAEGQYATCLAAGLIKLSAPPAGIVTADVKGDASGAGYVDSAARIVERILTTRAGFDASDLDADSFADLHNANPAPMGVYVQTERYLDEVIDQLLSGIGGYIVPSRLGVWTAGRFAGPSGAPVATITDGDILSGEFVPASDSSEGLPVYRVRATWGRVWQQLGDSDIAGVVDQPTRAWMTRDWRETVALDLVTLGQWPNAAEIDFETLLTDADDADAEVARELALRAQHRDFLQLTVAMDADLDAVDLGRVVRLASPRFLGSRAPKDMVVTGITVQGRRGRYTLTLWG